MINSHNKYGDATVRSGAYAATPLVLPAARSCVESAEDGLLGHAQRGCFNCRNQLIENNADRLRLFVDRMMFGLPESEDVFQQTICRALTKIEQFRGDSSFITWLCSIALNEVRQIMRKERRAHLLALDETLLDKASLTVSYRSAFDLCCQAEERAKIRRAVRRLRPPFRSVVELRVFEGLSLEQTAKCLGLSLSATKSRYFRARNRLLTLAPASAFAPRGKMNESSERTLTALPSRKQHRQVGEAA